MTECADQGNERSLKYLVDSIGGIESTKGKRLAAG